MLLLENIKKTINARRGTFIFEEALGITENALNLRGRVETLETTSAAEDTITDNLVTLSGVAANEPDLGTFTGTIIPDDSDVKEALQALETDAVALQTASGIAAEATSLGTFTGSIIPDSSTIKDAFQALETDVEAIQSVTGVAAEAVNLGTFTGITIADNSTVKEALQDIETAHEIMTGGAFDATGTHIDTNSTDASGISVVTLKTNISSAGAESRTLAAPNYTDGQMKLIEMTVNGGDVTLALTNIVGAPTGTTATFGATGQNLVLMSVGGVWVYLGGTVPIA